MRTPARMLCNLHAECRQDPLNRIHPVSTWGQYIDFVPLPATVSIIHNRANTPSCANQPLHDSLLSIRPLNELTSEGVL